MRHWLFSRREHRDKGARKGENRVWGWGPSLWPRLHKQRQVSRSKIYLGIPASTNTAQLKTAESERKVWSAPQGEQNKSRYSVGKFMIRTNYITNKAGMGMSVATTMQNPPQPTPTPQRNTSASRQTLQYNTDMSVSG
ncbi:hypothetical protein E2C01_070329 [Portunus trituberculatus]|uniref:Uncharacterized protein n=1 Tax=Portunus trituberculatus TaxID=210409 RepID=A0A5B7I1Z0_PORTR|nr:hypothetical protein [Portunus trituberculatus]